MIKNGHVIKVSQRTPLRTVNIKIREGGDII